MTPQELRASILQLAIQGKLVEHYPQDKLSEELIKKTILSDENDIPFEIPETWSWHRLEDIATLYNGRAYKKPEMLADGKYPLLRVGNLFTSDIWYYSDLELEPEKYCDNGDLLYAWSASFGPHIWNGGKVIYHYHIWKVALRYPQMRDYLYWVLTAQTDSIKRRGHGSTMIHITKAGTEKMLIPVPPLAEQKRIVARIEELLPYIDRYEQAWSKLEDFNKCFPVDMQKSILQMAIQGKLVEQRPEEGTGEELYQQIQAEKRLLIKVGKIKKEKPLPEIAEAEIPFDIPETWKWVQLGDIASINGGFAFKSTNYTTDGVRVIRISDFNESGFVNDKIVRHPYDDSLGAYVLEEKNILLCMTGGTVGKSLFVKKMNEQMIVNQRVATIKVQTSFPEYVYQVILAPVTQTVIQHSKNSTNDNISMDAIKGFLIPLPPLAEQKRIVAKLEEILPLCERLK